MKINQKKTRKSTVRASRYTRPARAIKAEDEIIDDAPAAEEEAAVVVEPEATDLLFEAEDVAELLNTVTGEEVEVSAEDDAVVFTVGDYDYTVEAEGDEEILETSRKVLKGKKRVAASTRARAAKPAQRPARRPVRK